MNTNCDPDRPNVVSQSYASAFCGSGFRRSDDMRAVILNANEMSLASSIRESVGRALGEVDSEPKSTSNKSADEIKSIF